MTLNTNTLEPTPTSTCPGALVSIESQIPLSGRKSFRGEGREAVKLRHIVCPVDICDTEQPALQQALQMAQAHSARVHVVYVYQTPFWFVQDLSAIMAREIDRVLARELAKATGDSISLQRHVLEGQPFERIMEIARQTGADVIVAQKSARPISTLPWKTTIADRLEEQPSIRVITVS
ncbi:MAG: universal stress protein [Myxococcales bacterium]|nr:universal stress protein [Myxococcales bacterium]